MISVYYDTTSTYINLYSRYCVFIYSIYIVLALTTAFLFEAPEGHPREEGDSVRTVSQQMNKRLKTSRRSKMWIPLEAGGSKTKAELR